MAHPNLHAKSSAKKFGGKPEDYIHLHYCLFMSVRRWNKDVLAGGLGILPGLDTLGLLLMCWILAPVDILLTWIRIYKEAEEDRRNNSKIF